jgi:hypothetical protein
MKQIREEGQLPLDQLHHLCRWLSYMHQEIFLNKNQMMMMINQERLK